MLNYLSSKGKGGEKIVLARIYRERKNKIKGEEMGEDGEKGGGKIQPYLRKKKSCHWVGMCLWGEITPLYLNDGGEKKRVVKGKKC